MQNKPTSYATLAADPAAALALEQAGRDYAANELTSEFAAEREAVNAMVALLAAEPVFDDTAGEYKMDSPAGGHVWAETATECRRLYMLALAGYCEHARHCPVDAPLMARDWANAQQDEVPA